MKINPHYILDYAALILLYDIMIDEKGDAYNEKKI